MHSGPRHRRRRDAGFTLIELTIGAALMALILGSAYACLHSGLTARRLLEPRWEAIQSARVALAMMTADFRAACPLSKESDFVGIDRKIGEVEADNVDFGTMNHSPKGPGEGDFCQTSYYLDQDRASGEFVLWRRRNPRIGLDPFVGGSREEIARGVRQLKFEYYDGFDWYDTWGDTEGNGKRETSALAASNLTGFPEAVRITLAFAAESRSRTSSATDAVPAGASAGSGSEADRDPPLVYQTIVRVNGLGIVSGSGSSGTMGTGTGSGSASASGSASPSNPGSARSGGSPGSGAAPGRGR